MEHTLNIFLAPYWEELESIRTKAHTFLENQGLPEDLIHSSVMVLSELLENSIKYGRFSDPDNRVGVNLEISRNMITVEVSNPVDDSCLPDLKKLDRMIQWVRGYQDPFEAYVERLKEVSKKPLKDEESGLGIARIAYEGDVTLDFVVNDEDVLTVSAVRRI
jgi:hypothetical protein